MKRSAASHLYEGCSAAHPLDSSSGIHYALNSLFYSWVYRIIKLGRIEFLDIKPLPKAYKVHNSFKQWQQTTKHKTLSKILHIHKHSIIKVFLLNILNTCFIGTIYYIFIDPLSIAIYSKNNGAMFIYALIILVICVMYTICDAQLKDITMKVQAQCVSSLELALFQKTLTLCMNESDKQQILSLVSSDITAINSAFTTVLGFAPSIILPLLLCVVGLSVVIGSHAVLSYLFLILIGIPLQIFVGVKYSQCLKQKMNVSDKRVTLISQLIRGVRILKVLCYEIAMMKKIKEYRNEETVFIYNRDFYFALILLLNLLIPITMLIIIFLSIYFRSQHDLSANIILNVLILMSIVVSGIRGLPVIIGDFSAFMVASNRIDEFLKRESNQSIAMSVDPEQKESNTNDVMIEIENASFVWTESDANSNTFLLENVSLAIKRGKLIAMIGSVGSGKTSLIHSLIGEMKCISGELHYFDNTEIAFCCQIPYIRNATVRDNIVLDLEYNEKKYKECICAAALIPDLQKFPEFDSTVIGDEGVNISGGQKMRISFARALYRKDCCNVFLLDDPLSSVDVYVGRHMFMNGIYNYLLNGDNTVLMVLNSHLSLLKYFDEIIVLNQGRAEMHCTIKELYCDSNREIYDKYCHLLPNRNIFDNDDDDIYDNDDTNMDIDEKELQSYKGFDVYDNMQFDTKAPTFATYLEYFKSSLIDFNYESYFKSNDIKMNQSESIKQSKSRLILPLLPLFLMFCVQCCIPWIDVCVLKWKDMAEDIDIKWTVIICSIIITVFAFSVFYFVVLFSKISSKATNHTYCKSLYNILRAKILFFDLTPRGEIMNICAKDIDVLDNVLSSHFFCFVLTASVSIGYFIIVFCIIPLSLIPFVLIITPMLWYIWSRFQSSYFSLVFIEQKLMDPILTLFAETTSNLDSIRSYKLQTYFIEEMKDRIDEERKYRYMSQCIYQWMALYVGICINIMQFCAILCGAMYMQLHYANNNKELIILSLWYFIQIQQALAPALHYYIETQVAVVSIHRLMTYHQSIDHESKLINPQYTVSELSNTKWPQCGDVHISKLQLMYRKKFGIILDIDKEIKIAHGSKIGIVGRTGSGKSSILVSIFRLFEPSIDSRVEIDELEFNKLGLFDLRSNLSIINQTSILFGNCSLRFNLDPFDEYDDDDICNAIKTVSLSLLDVINKRDKGIHCLVDDDASNFSVGEQQLLCFSRAILRKSPVLFMDEATSSIDANTDNIIQELIRSEAFENVTVISVAHRIQTIIDYDYILVIKNGKIAEYDTPQNLLKQPNGIFAKLAKTNALY